MSISSTHFCINLLNIFIWCAVKLIDLKFTNQSRKHILNTINSGIFYYTLFGILAVIWPTKRAVIGLYITDDYGGHTR